MISRNKYRVASILALTIGLLSIKEGGGVLLGWTTKAYTILPWLVWYNVLLGVLSVVTGVGFWQMRGWGIRYAATIVSLHAVVLVIVAVLYALTDAAALASVLAMLIRTAVWTAIIFLVREKEEKRPDTRAAAPESSSRP